MTRENRSWAGGQTGRRLAELCGVPYEVLIECARFVNLLGRWPGRARSGTGDAWQPQAARRYAREVVWPLVTERDIVVLLGRKVADAMAVEGEPCGLVVEAGRPWLVTLPHPSGVNRWWNDPQHRRQAVALMQLVAHSAGIGCSPVAAGRLTGRLRNRSRICSRGASRSMR